MTDDINAARGMSDEEFTEWMLDKKDDGMSIDGTSPRERIEHLLQDAYDAGATRMPRPLLSIRTLLTESEIREVIDGMPNGAQGVYGDWGSVELAARLQAAMRQKAGIV